MFQLIYEGQEHLVESKAAAAESLEEENEKAEREETEEKVGEGGVTRNSSIFRKNQDLSRLLCCSMFPSPPYLQTVESEELVLGDTDTDTGRH